MDITESTTTVKKKVKKKLGKKYLAAMVVLELLLLVIIIAFGSTLVSLNRHDEIIYSSESIQDEISCSDGKLIVNDVVATVPIDHDVKYNISYAWAEDDKDYPSIPKAITASYYREEKETPIYDISLYRDSFTPKAEIPSGKDSSNWFSDWETVDEPEMKCEQITSGEFHGFSISTLEAKKANELKSTAYLTDSFYFVVEDDRGISVYVLEGILYESKYKSKLLQAMRNSIGSLKIQVAPAVDETENENGSHPQDE